MAKITEKYEAVLIFSLKNGEDQIKALQAKFTDLVSANGTLVEAVEWGKRTLAYPIQFQKDGYYMLYKFDSVPSFPAELERVAHITEGVLRVMTVLRQENTLPKPEVKPEAKPEPAPEASAPIETPAE
jgi:small subunit ribosomal protein S6